jgi:hypothetical protein
MSTTTTNERYYVTTTTTTTLPTTINTTTTTTAVIWLVCGEIPVSYCVVDTHYRTFFFSKKFSGGVLLYVRKYSFCYVVRSRELTIKILKTCASKNTQQVFTKTQSPLSHSLSLSLSLSHTQQQQQKSQSSEAASKTDRQQ